MSDERPCPRLLFGPLARAHAMTPVYGGGSVPIRSGYQLRGNEAYETLRLLRQAIARAEQGRSLPIEWYRQAQALVNVLDGYGSVAK
jgi:hypothetical protein